MHPAQSLSLRKSTGNGFLVSLRASLSEFLGCSVRCTLSPRQASQWKLPCGHVRCHASLSTRSGHIEKVAHTPEVLSQHKPSEKFGGPSRERLSPDAWTELLDPYLPLELRSKAWLVNLASFEGVRSISTLPSLLTAKEARRAFPLGLLGHIAVSQGRWVAWLWLIEEILNHNTKSIGKATRVAIPRLLHYGPGPLDEITKSPISAEVKAPNAKVADSLIGSNNAGAQAKNSNRSTVSLDAVTGSLAASDTSVHRTMKDTVGQLWQSIAMIILDATDRESDQTTEMMSFVYQAVALLHQHGWIPQSIYSSDLGDGPVDLRKPPLMELLSWRIMITLADSVWKFRERERIIENDSVDISFAYKGNELPGGEYQPRLRPLGTATWLEFVLWSCVESSMIPDASRIVDEIAKRKEGNKWKVISWDVLQESAINKRREAAKMKPGFFQWWLNNLRGISDGYNEELPLIEMDERTVSSEVVANIVDSLVSSVRGNEDQYGMRSSGVRHFVNRCKSLLQRQDYTLETSFWNSVVLRLIDSEYYPPSTAPGVLSRVLDLSGKEQKLAQKAGLETQSGLMAGHSAASFGLLHQILECYCHLGDAIGAVRTFKRIQNWTNDNRQSIRSEIAVEFTGESSPTEAFDENGMDRLGYQIPHSTLAIFLDLLTDAKEYEVANLLLSSTDVDVSPGLYESTVLQPALLRFASMTSNSELVIAVTDCMAEQSNVFSDEALKAILHCQIRLGNWPEVDKLFDQLATERRLQVEALDIMTLAGTIIRLQQAIESGTSDQVQLSQAQGMLKLLLRGKYRPRPDPSQPRDYSQVRLLNQCNRLLASVPELKRSTVSWVGPQNLQAHAAVPIPARAFNVLLDAIVEMYGSERGKAMFDAWCLVRNGNEIDAKEIKSEATPLSDEECTFTQEKVVPSNQQTVRTILQPLLSTQQASRTPGQKNSSHDMQMPMSFCEKSTSDPCQTGQDPTEAVLEWGVEMYRKMGLTDPEIKVLVPVSFRTETRGTSQTPQTAKLTDDEELW